MSNKVKQQEHKKAPVIMDEEVYSIDPISRRDQLKMEFNVLSSPIFSRNKFVKEGHGKKYIFDSKQNIFVAVSPAVNDHPHRSSKIPQVLEEKVFFALLNIFENQGQELVITDIAQLARIAQITYNGKNANRIYDALYRLFRCEIEFNNAFFTPRSKENISLKLRLVDTLVEYTFDSLDHLTDVGREEKERLQAYFKDKRINKLFALRINSDIMRNIKDNMYRYFNIKTLLSIADNVARKLYMMIQKDAFYEKARPFKRRAGSFASHVPLSWNSRSYRQTIDRLTRGLEYLTKHGYLDSFTAGETTPLWNTYYLLYPKQTKHSLAITATGEVAGEQLSLLNFDETPRTAVLPDKVDAEISRLLNHKPDIPHKTVVDTLLAYAGEYSLEYLVGVLRHTLGNIKHARAFRTYFDKAVRAGSATYKQGALNQVRARGNDNTKVYADILNKLPDSEINRLKEAARVAYNNAGTEQSRQCILLKVLQERIERHGAEYYLEKIAEE